MFHSVQSSGVHWTADIGTMFVVIQSIFQWNPVHSTGLGLDSQSSGLGLDSEKGLGVQ